MATNDKMEQASHSVWSEEETLALINGYKNLMHGLISFSKSDWLALTKHLQREGVNKTVPQVYHKWGSLFRTYKANLGKSRHDFQRTSKFTYFKALDDIFLEEEEQEEEAERSEEECRNSRIRIVSPKKLLASIENSNYTDNDCLAQDQTEGNCTNFVIADMSNDGNTTDRSGTSSSFPKPKQRKQSAKEKYYKAKKMFIENENRRREANFRNKMKCRRERNEFLTELLETIVAKRSS